MKVEEPVAVPSPPAPVAAPTAREPDGPFSGRLGPWFAVAVVATVLVGVILRFVTRSAMWEDEAITVAIARRPLGQLRHLLSHDGAPPLYYVLTHYWMKVFGTSNLGARSLSGVIGVATLPVAWLAGRRLGGADRARAQWIAWGALLVFASSAYAIRYSTEARMYQLEILLVLAGYLAVANALERPRFAWLVAVAAVTAALLYTHYWTFYLLIVVGGGLLVAGIRGGARHPAWRIVAAIVVGSLTFVPWLPTFLYQAKHTGTPWAQPLAPGKALHADLLEFSGTDNLIAYGLLYLGVVLGFVALFGAGIDRFRTELDWRTRPGTRWVWFAGYGTLALALAAAWRTHSGSAPRYAAIVFGLIALMVVCGIAAFKSAMARYVLLGVLVLGGTFGGLRNAVTARTQAAAVSRIINTRARPGDIVVYCPDQVGPDVSRLVHASVRQVTFPRLDPPELINWVDYDRRNHVFHRAGVNGNLANPKVFANEILGRTGEQASVWLVWSTTGYKTIAKKCESLIGQFRTLRPNAKQLVASSPGYFERQGLTRYRPGPAPPGGSPGAELGGSSGSGSNGASGP